MATQQAIDLIKKHEGLRLQMYKDSRGISTIGYGHNLESGSISESACNQILSDDIERTESALNVLPWYNQLSDTRKAVILDMAFNMGVPGLLNFYGMISAIISGDYQKASVEMLSSLWAQQVGPRAKEDSTLMAEG